MNAKRLWYLIAILAIFMAACNAPSTPTPAPTSTPLATGVPRFESNACWFKAPLGRDVECGYLIVPEDHAKPDGPTIKLAVARFKSSDSNAAPDPIVYLEGGPGGSPLHAEAPIFDAIFGPLAEKRDVILFDQRGTGYSQPALDCPEIKQEALDTLDENLSSDKSAELSTQAALKCRDRLVKSGVNLAVFNSAQNAADIEALRQALGYTQLNLYGTSYGTRLALTAMRDHPQGLRSVIIDSVVPLQADLYAHVPVNGARAIEAVFTTCEADAACHQNFPDVRQVFLDLKTKFDTEPITYTVTLRSGEKKEALLNGDGLVNLLFQDLYVTSLIPGFPRLIYDVRDGDTDMLSGLTAVVLTQLDDISFGMNYSVQCQEEVPFINANDLNTYLQQHPEYAPLDDKSSPQVCKAWGVPAAQPIENQAVTSDIPTLVFSGEFDPITPPEYGQLAAQTLSKSFYFEIPRSGHAASVTEECPRSMLLAFLDNPTQKPDAACLSDMSKTAFTAPLKASDFKLKPLTEAQLGISSVIPEGWQQISAGMYSPSGKTSDQTFLMLQAAPIAPDTFLNFFKQQLSQANYTIEFAPAGTRTANGIDWTLYSAQADVGSIDVALGQKNGTTYLILLSGPLNDRKALVEGVFLPAIDALKPTR